MADWLQKLFEIAVFRSEIDTMLTQTPGSWKPVFITVFLVMAGGSLGALARYGTGLMAAGYFGIRFPYGTMIANLAGCFLIGICFALADKTDWLSPSARLFLMTGFLGAYTTFSTYAVETIAAVRSGTISVAVLNVLLNNMLGLALALAGIGLVHVLVRP